MENKFLLQLLEKLNTDTDFFNEFMNKKTDDDMYEFASNTISGYTKEEFLEMLNSLRDFENNNKLSDDKLDNVSGGSIIGVIAAGATGFLSGGGRGLLGKLSDKLDQKERDRKYEEFKRKHGLTDDQVAEMLAEQEAVAGAQQYKQGLLEKFKKEL